MTRLIVENEEARQNALRDLRLLDTEPSESFDRITRLASRLLSAPVSTVSLTDHDRQWFKSKFGADLVQIPRSEAPCNYAIHSNEVFVVPDMRTDPRFMDSLLARAGIRFYAGAPLITRSGYGLGTLCVLDDKPRVISEDEQHLLIDLAAVVMTQIEVQNTIGRIDPMSGYPNEYQLYEDLEDSAQRSPEEDRVGMLIELVSAQQVNHGSRVLGAAYVEELIRGSAGSVRRAVGAESRLYHVGPTRFLVLLDKTRSADWEELAHDLDHALREAVYCSGIPVTCDPVIGVYHFGTASVSPRDVLRRLFNAADDARKTGKQIATYATIGDEAHTRSFTLLSDMRKALEQPGEFTLLYQPVVEIASGQCVGAEALLRWHHKTLGDVMPGEFIPLAEETAFIRPLTEWVFDTAIGQLALWRKTRRIAKLSINASARNLEEDDFANRIDAMLSRHGVAAESIQLEFTESALVSYSARVVDQLVAIKQLGVSIAIDDFGTGYSNLSYLQQIPASVLKIDQSFIRPLAQSEHHQKLVRAVIFMAHDLGYRVVAEGIEDQATLDQLAAWKCDEAQGYHFAMPLPADAMGEWLKRI